MRRMYSEKELSVLVYQAVGQYIEDGAFDEITAESVNAYLEEHPVDITALEGQDISLATLTSTGDVDVGGDLEVTGSISGAEIVEIMSGYSFTPATGDTRPNWTPIYVSAVKNGNKVTFVVFGSLIKRGNTGFLGYFSIPSAVASKLYPTAIGDDNILDARKIPFLTGNAYTSVDTPVKISKSGSGMNFWLDQSGLTADTTYIFRYEVTFLLSENLVSE